MGTIIENLTFSLRDRPLLMAWRLKDRVILLGENFEDDEFDSILVTVLANSFKKIIQCLP
jgi:hypothetical protein